MNNMSNALKNTLSISLFNRGQAGKIFDSVKTEGTKIVIKNNKPECILLSPEEYINIMEELENARLLQIAVERKEKSNGHTISLNEIMELEKISEDDIEDFESVDIE